MTDDTKRTSLSQRVSEVLQIKEEEKKQEIIQDFLTDKDTHDDFEYVRDTLKGMVEKAKDAVENLEQVAKESENARHYEVLANLIKTTGDTAEKILDIRKKKKDIEKEIIPSDNGKAPAIGNANIFVGTSAELLRMIKNKGQTETVDVTPAKEN